MTAYRQTADKRTETRRERRAKLRKTWACEEDLGTTGNMPTTPTKGWAGAAHEANDWGEAVRCGGKRCAHSYHGATDGES